MSLFSISGLSRLIQKIEAGVLSTAIIIIALMTITNVITRSLLGFSLAFTEELSQFLIIVVTFVGLSYAASQGRHIRMTAIYDQLSLESRKFLMILIVGTTSVLMFFLAWFSLRYISTVEMLGSVSPVLEVPYYLVYLAAPLGFFLAGIQYALTLVRNLQEPDVYLSYEKKDEYEEPVSGEI